MTEKDVERKIILEASQCGSTLFKNNVGEYITPYGYYVHYGLCKGSSDLIGWTPITITAGMVGKKVAIFTAVEVKKNKKGSYRATDSQKNFINAVKSAGGFAGVADCTDDLFEILEVL